jgi:tetratricopeptide (TPR) repeat protein
MKLLAGLGAWLCVGLVTGTMAVAADKTSETPSRTAGASASASAGGHSGPAPTASADTKSGAGSAVAAPKLAAGARLTPITVKKGAAPPPPPSASQLKAFQELESEARHYEDSAKDYRRLLTMVVRHHYEERRRRILSVLNHEIDVENQGLKEARADAIRRLEAFVARYSGENADPSATPDAMFRLAALYEEKARADYEADLAVGLKPAIKLYLKLIQEFPHYEEIAAVHYFLGHAYTDAARLEEGQQAWRSVVCANRFTVEPDPKTEDGIVLQSLSQDHDDAFWSRWYNENPIPLDQAAPRRGRRAGAMDAEDELVYKNPYAGCEPLAQKIEPGEEPRYVAELWWQLGNHHFDQLDMKGGPYNLNRAVTAYGASMRFKKPPLYGVSMYKLAWTYFKQQRYAAAVKEFVRLLYYADEQQRETGDPGADFRTEAYTYIAGSLTYVDFDGPPPEDPYIPRNDVLDLEPDPLVAEQKMSIALQRVQDPATIPQDQVWTVEIYKSLAQEFIEITQNHNAVAALELTLKKFPLDRDAPTMQYRVAELYEELGRLAPEGSAARADYAGKALEARTQLAAYVGTSPWTDANRDDPEALQQAELLVRGGLKRAAADHTNYARAYYEKALELNDPGEQTRLLEKSVAEYRLAEQGWYAYLEQDPTALDTYDTRFWLADARYWPVVLQVAMGRSPGDQEVEAAREAITAVRDSNEDDRYQQPSAFYLVSLAEKILEDKYRLFAESDGTRGVEKRSEVEFTGEGADRKVVRAELPSEVLAAINARDEYNARIPLDRDPERNGLLYAFQAADYYFVYGHFKEARARFQPLYASFCGKNEWGYKAWEKLISMSNFEGDVEGSRRLVEGKSCAYSEETKLAEEQIRTPVRQGVAYLDARKFYDEAEKMAPGPGRDKKWRTAAAAYKVALDAAPDRDEAPEAAMNGAYAYKQVGEYDKAIAMYELFISRYGDAATLEKLRRGDAKAQPPIEPQPDKYEARVKYLKNAYDALASSYVLFFNYPRAAETFDKISTTPHFSNAQRREAAHQALVLYASLGDAGGMGRARQRFIELGASPTETAEADYVVASADLKRWDRLSPSKGANEQARQRAQSVMLAYYTRYRAQDAGAQYVVRAAYAVAVAQAAANTRETDRWRRTVIEAFEKWKRLAPREGGRNTALGSLEAGMAAEVDYASIDDQLRKSFDYESGFHRYKGTPIQVVGAYNKDAVEAKRWYDQLQRVVDEYLSPEWTTVAVARQGSLYDSLRSGLYNTRPPELKMFDAKTEALLKKAEQSDNLDLQEKADAVRVKVRQAWRDKRDQELQSADRVMVDRYATSIALARRYNLSKPEVTRAIRRLAFLADLTGEAQMAQLTSSVQDLDYKPGMFAKMRPGLAMAPQPDIRPAPLPAAAQ